MTQSVDQLVQYEYVPMSQPYSEFSFGFAFGEGVGINASGGVRGAVAIHKESPNEVFVSVFADTGARRLAPSSWRQATVRVVREGRVLAEKVAAKTKPYMIATGDMDLYLGSVTLSLSPPVDMTPVHVAVEVFWIANFYEGAVSGPSLKATIPIAVRRVLLP